jgi:hypothetical protein
MRSLDALSGGSTRIRFRQSRNAELPAASLDGLSEQPGPEKKHRAEKIGGYILLYRTGP